MSVSEVIVLLAPTLLLAAVYVRLRLLMCLTMPLEVEAFHVASPEERRTPESSHTALSLMSRPIGSTVYISELRFRFRTTIRYKRYFTRFPSIISQS